MPIFIMSWIISFFIMFVFLLNEGVKVHNH